MHPRECMRRCASGIQLLIFRYSRGKSWGDGGDNGRERVLGNHWSAGESLFGVSLVVDDADEVLGGGLGKLGTLQGEGMVEGACHSDCSGHTGTLEPHTDNSWPHATCLDTPGILMIFWSWREVNVGKSFQKNLCSNYFLFSYYIHWNINTTEKFHN